MSVQYPLVIHPMVNEISWLGIRSDLAYQTIAASSVISWHGGTSFRVHDFQLVENVEGENAGRDTW